MVFDCHKKTGVGVFRVNVWTDDLIAPSFHVNVWTDGLIAPSFRVNVWTDGLIAPSFRANIRQFEAAQCNQTIRPYVHTE
jgi:hypothetical protein